jgi:hypothetical protein
MPRRKANATPAVHSAPAPAADQARLARLLGGPAPGTLAEAGERIAVAVAAGRRAAIDICVLLAHARREWFADDPAKWLEWARDEFGYERRHCFTCLKAGGLLLEPAFDECDMSHLTGCDIPKLEALASIPTTQLAPLLKRWDPAHATREEVREKVKLWCPEEDKEDARATRREPRRTDPAVAFERHLTEAKKILDDPATAEQAGESCQSVQLIELAFHILAHACERQAARPWWTEPMVKIARQGLSGLNLAMDEVGRKLGY